MNILIVSSQYPPINRANLYTENMSLHYMARQWAKAGHNVIAFPLFIQPESFLSDPRNNFSKKICNTVADGVSLFIKDFKVKSSKAPIAKKAIRKAARKYRKLLKKLPKIDLLIVHEPSSAHNLADYLRLSCPKVVVFTTKDSKTTTVQKFARYNKIYTAFGFTLESVKARMENIIKTDKPCFVTQSEAPNLIVPARYNRVWESDKLRMVFIGELAPFKNIDVIINAIARAKHRDKLHLDIIGIGSMEPALRRLISNLDLNDTVTLRGSMLKADAFMEMRESEVFIMASNHASFGLTHLEAMSQGCIPICVEDERVDGFVTHGVSGFVVKEKDIDALAQQLDSIAELSKKKLAEISNAAVESVNCLTEESTAARYLERITSALNHNDEK